MKVITVMLLFNIPCDVTPCQGYFGIMSKFWADETPLEIELSLCLI
jgi:hypothetical protein